MNHDVELAKKRLDIDGFTSLMGIEAQDLSDSCKALIEKCNFNYSPLPPQRFRSTVLQVLKTIGGAGLSVSGAGRKQDWEKGWAENLQGFIDSGHDLSSLTPKYMHKHKTRRLFGDYIDFEDDDFELNFYTVYRRILFEKYLEPYDPIFEFGCGTGYNLVILSQLYPNKKLIGLDWSESSAALLKEIAMAHKIKLEARHFDFFNPDYDLKIPPGSAFVTFNSLEQIGSDYERYLQFIMDKQPAICLNSEPFVELYDESDLLDYLAIRYHLARNYLNGYIDALRKLKSRERIEMIKEQRVRSGNLFHEGYSYVVFRPDNSRYLEQYYDR